MGNINPSTIETLVKDVQHIIENGRKQAYASINQLSIITYWNVGRRIVEEEQCGKARAVYGTQLIKKLADTLTPVYGNSYSKRNLDYYKKFYLLFPDAEIVNTRVHNLDWSHICELITIDDELERSFYGQN